MTCTCNREELLRHLQVAARGLSTRTSIQVLAGIQLAARDGELHLAATDMELSVRTRLAAEVEADGVAVVTGKLLLDIVRLLSGETVRLAFTEGMLSVTSGESTYQLNAFDADDFPQLPRPGGDLVSIPGDAFTATVQAVSRAASQDESRPVLTGVNMRIASDGLTMVATDSYRLSTRTTPASVDLPEAITAVVPARALDELVRIVDQAPATQLALGISEGHALFGIDDTWVTARLIEGQFPNHEALIPKEFASEARIARAELLEVVNRTRLLAQRNSPLRLAFADGQLTVSARQQDVGAATETMAVEYQGEPLQVGFNAEFLRDGVQSVEEDVVVLRLVSPRDAGLLSGEDEGFRYLLMPVELRD